MQSKNIFFDFFFSGKKKNPNLYNKYTNKKHILLTLHYDKQIKLNFISLILSLVVDFFLYSIFSNLNLFFI